MPPSTAFVSRAGDKLDHALRTFALNPAGFVCADLGCNVGGFTDCLLRHGAAHVFAVDTGYGVLDYRLRKDPRVTTLERTNALHLTLPQPVDLAVIDVAWTRQRLILPAALKLLKPTGQIITLVKPHYEAVKSHLRQGILDPAYYDETIAAVRAEVVTLGLQILAWTDSPITGTGGNREALALVTPVAD
jgi:23S rRNA (cytidine1920-2'-O)/16S rRNA (cytidine1409-2'-O)-methyltransferase